MLRMEQRRTVILTLIPMVLLTTACGSSGSRPSAEAITGQQAASAAVSTPPASAPPQSFTSQRYGFRVTLTTAWSEQDAQSDWNGTALEGLQSPDFANFTDVATERTFAAASAPVAKGTQLAAWRAAVVRAAPDVCTDSKSAQKTTLGGEPALMWTAKCSDGFDVTKLAARHGTRGYVILLGSAAGNDPAVDRSVFESMRQSFHFTR